MTLPAPTSISAFPRGHEFPAARFVLPRAQADAYLRAVGDEGGYGETLPPLAVAALALNALQEQIALPEGSLHTGQEVEHFAAVRAGEPLTLTARIAQRSERQGYVISVIEFEIAAAAGTAVGARTTIMAPGAPA
jgi:hypothetical protein